MACLRKSVIKAQGNRASLLFIFMTVAEMSPRPIKGLIQSRQLRKAYTSVRAQDGPLPIEQNEIKTFGFSPEDCRKCWAPCHLCLFQRPSIESTTSKVLPALTLSSAGSVRTFLSAATNAFGTGSSSPFCALPTRSSISWRASVWAASHLDTKQPAHRRREAEQQHDPLVLLCAS
jgi:hypothetical protein